MNIDLPTADYADEIKDLVDANKVVIIQAETGAGKSTQVPQMLYEAGYKVIVTQPRRLAARTVAQRVAEEMGFELGAEVGFQTAEERYTSDDTEILFCTDGLQLVRELSGEASDADTVLIIDEVHEWNRNIETLVAWCKLQMQRGANFKLVLMSATVEAQKLSTYYDGAPVLNVPGRSYPVTQEYMPGKVHEVTASFLRSRHNVLVFVDGKAKIENIITDLKLLHTDAEILPLHGEMDAADQNLVFRHYNRPKATVATKVAETSVTIDDTDVVVDTGLAKRAENRNGVDGIYIYEISQAECLQRMGRAGRTKPGTYVLVSKTRLQDRPLFSEPEIMLTRLDGLVLGLAEAGMDALELEFFHQPPRENLIAARDALVRLGAMRADGSVTKIGKRMNRLPVEAHYARMIVEAEELGVQSEVVAIVACLESGGIRAKGEKIGRYFEPPKWHKLTKETNSDLLAELDCFLAAGKMSNSEMKQNDIFVKAFYKARELQKRLCRHLGIQWCESVPEDRAPIVRACVAGMIDHLYRNVGGQFVSDDGASRQLDRNSVVQSSPAWVCGLPFDIEVKNERTGSKFMLHLLGKATVVAPDLLCDLAPELVSEREDGHSYVALHGEVMKRYKKFFNDVEIDVRFEPAEECDDARLALAAALARGAVSYDDMTHNNAVVSQLRELSYRHSVSTLRESDLAVIFYGRLGSIWQVKDLAGANLRLELKEYVPDDLAELSVELTEETFEHEGVELQVRINPEGVRYSFRGISVIVTIAEKDLARLQMLPSEIGGRRVERVDVVLEDGSEKISTYSYGGSSTLTSLREQLKRHNIKKLRDAAVEGQKLEIEALRTHYDSLTATGKPTAVLAGHIATATDKARSLGFYHRANYQAELNTAIKAAQKEVERLSGDTSELLLEGLMNGSIYHFDTAHNLRVIAAVDAYSIRSGGFIEPFTEQMLRAHYTKCLEGVSTADQLQVLDLKLNQEDYAPAEFLEELRDDLAPEVLQVEGRKAGTTQDFALRYSFAEAEGKQVPTATVRMPAGTYLRVAAQFGKPSRLPTLPHGITLIIEAELDAKTSLSGQDSVEFAKKVEKRQKAKRPTEASEAAKIGQERMLLGGNLGPSAPPPWFRGRIRG